MFFPFNHNPIARKSGGGAYTCPVGRYARVTIQWDLYISFIAELSGVASALTGFSSQSGKAQGSVEIWVDENDQVNTIVTPTSGKAFFTEAGGAGTRQAKGSRAAVTCAAQVISANPAGSYSPVQAQAVATANVDTITTTGNGAANFADGIGSGTISMHVEEYYKAGIP